MMLMFVSKQMIVVILLCAELFYFVYGGCTLPGSPFEFSTKSGTIQSNGYPDRYYGNEECDWTIHPPEGTYPELFVLRFIKIDTNIDDVPASDLYCRNAKDYLTVNGERACGEVTSYCISYILQSSSSSLDCHKALRNKYPDCIDHTVSHRQWPITFSFRTSQPNHKAGFKLNYSFADCGSSPFPFPFPPDNQATEISSTTDTLFNNETSSEVATGKTYKATSTTKSTTRPTLSESTTTTTTRPLTPANDRTSIPGKVQSTNTTTARTTKEGVTSAVLTAMLVVLCVVLFVVILAILFRKRLYVWVKKEKKPVHMNGNVEKGEAPEYTDAYLVPIGENHTSDRPLPGAPPPVPPPYRSVSSVNSDKNLINEESNSLQYDRLGDAWNCANAVLCLKKTTSKGVIRKWEKFQVLYVKSY